jgi:hypothetical protein
LLFFVKFNKPTFSGKNWSKIGDVDVIDIKLHPNKISRPEKNAQSGHPVRARPKTTTNEPAPTCETMAAHLSLGNTSFRVTRLGEFSPIERLFILGSFLKEKRKQTILLYFLPRQNLCFYF